LTGIRVSAPIKILLAAGSMSMQGWHAALMNAFQRSGLDVDLQTWNEQPIGARYAIVWLPPAALFAAEPKLRAVINLGAGVDALLGRAVVPVDVPIVRLVDAGMGAKIAEYVCFAIARMTRALERFAPPPAGLRDWNASRPRDAAPTVGVLGLGAMGLASARAVAQFGYPVVGWTRRPREVDGVEMFAGFEQLRAFLARANIVVNTLPLTAQTENLLDRRAFSQMPRGSHLINVGRGGTIVDADLIAALDDGQLASATLDVFRTEPLPPDHPFWAHEKITITPHIAAPTPYGPAAEQIAAALKVMEAGARPQDLPGYVDRTTGY
jgi:glyoxylate/hydroxypyruvate reductase